MSLWGKLSWSVSVVSLIVVLSALFILGGFTPWLNVFLYVFIIGVVLAIFLDYRFYLSILLMRTTRNGMTMGASIALTLAFCGSLAYLSKRFEISVDVTEEKINSLSPQTLQLLKDLKEDMNLVVFYKGVEGRQKKALIKRNFRLFKQASGKIKIRYYDAYVENQKAQEYLNPLPERETEDIFVFAEYKGKKVLVDVPFSEEKITSAMIQSTRREKKTVYFIYGHGERELSSSDRGGLSELEKAFQQSSFNVKSWSFIKDGPLPEDVSVLVSAGPRQVYLQREIEWLEQYLQAGGKAVFALDPDKKDNLKPWLEKFGVLYDSHYILDQRSAMAGLGFFAPFGIYFDRENAITRSFPGGSFALFHVAGRLKIKYKDSLSTVELVRTDSRTMAVKSMKSREGERTSHTVALLVEQTNREKDSVGNLIPREAEQEGNKTDLPVKEKEKNNKKADMKIAVFGDSDFFSNNLLNKGGVNRDLIMNTVSYLADEADLVSLRPKRLKATQLILRTYDRVGMILLGLILPISFFIVSFVIWLKRRSA